MKIIRFIQVWNMRLMNWLATVAGKSIAFWLLVLWYLGWMAWNSLGPVGLRFDPYPYVFLLFLSNTVQLWYLPVITLQSNYFNTQLQELIEFVKTVVVDIRIIMDRLETVENRQLEESEAIHLMLESEQKVLENLVGMQEVMISTLGRVEAKTLEIDQEIDDGDYHG